MIRRLDRVMLAHAEVRTMGPRPIPPGSPVLPDSSAIAGRVLHLRRQPPARDELAPCPLDEGAP